MKRILLIALVADVLLGVAAAYICRSPAGPSVEIHTSRGVVTHATRNH